MNNSVQYAVISVQKRFCKKLSNEFNKAPSCTALAPNFFRSRIKAGMTVESVAAPLQKMLRVNEWFII